MIKQRIYDTIIIGAGPAGLAASITMADSGYSILLVDKEKFPRDKVCGDGLTGGTRKILNKFHLTNRVEQQGYLSKKTELTLNDTGSFTPENKVITLRRKIFDKILLDEAIRMGIEFAVGKFSGKITQKAGFSEIELNIPGSDKPLSISAKYIIIATGCQTDRPLTSPLFNKISKPDLIAYRGYYKAGWPVTNLKVYFKEELKYGYAWVFPMGENIFNIGCGGKISRRKKIKPGKCLNDFIDSMNKKYSTSGEWQELPRGAFLRTNLSNINTFKKSRNIILTGEACGSTYPFTGEGISKALDTGIVAGKCCLDALKLDLANYDLAKIYVQELRKKIKPFYSPYKIADFILTKPVLNRFFFGWLCRRTGTLNAIAGILDETIRPGQLFSLKRIIKLFKF